MFSKLKSALLFTVLLCAFAYMGISCGAPAAPKMQALHDSLATQELVPYKAKNGKWGLSTLSHQVVLPCEYEDIEIWTNKPEIIMIKQGEYWYVFDRKGNAIIAEGYKYISFQDNYWHLTKDKNIKAILRDASGKRTIIQNYHVYSIYGNFILCYNDKFNEKHIFDTTGKQLSNEVYSHVLTSNTQSSHALVSLDEKKYAAFSAEKGRITDYIFSNQADIINNYLINESDKDAIIIKNYSNEILYHLNFNDYKKSYIIYDSLILPIYTPYHVTADNLMTDTAISCTGRKQEFSYKHIERKKIYNHDMTAFSIDNGKTYHLIVSYYLDHSAVSKYTLTAEELASIYSPLDIHEGQYIVLKDGKYGVWSSITKKMLVAAEYTKFHHIRSNFFESSNQKTKYPYHNRLILTNDKGGILFDPKSKTSQNLSGFDMPSNNMYVKNTFADYLCINDDNSKYYAIYSVKAGKIIGILNNAFKDMVNESQKIFCLYSTNDEIPLMQIMPNNELVELAIVPNIKDNSIDFAWDNGIVSKSYFSDNEIIWYDFAGKTIQLLDYTNTYVSEYGAIVNQQLIYDIKLDKVNYRFEGEIYPSGSVLVDVYGEKDEDGNKRERVYLDWSGKTYAEQ